MRTRTGLAATVRSLLHELGIPMHTASTMTTVKPAAAQLLANATVDETAGQSEQAASPAPAPVAPPPAAPENPRDVMQTSAPAKAAQTEQKVPGKFLRRIQAVALWLRDTGLALAGYILILIVSGAGWKASFVGLHQFGVDHMNLDDTDAWYVPITFDGAALALTLSVARAAMSGRSAAVRRLGVIGFTLLSSGINYIHITDLEGRRIAALLPIAAVTVFESLMAEARKAYERRTGNVRPRLSLLRWVFDFTGTKAILRAYVLGIPLPDQMAEAAAVVEEQKSVSKPRGRRRHDRRPKAVQPKPPAAAEPPTAPSDSTPNDGDRAPVIDIELVRKFGEKSAHAITVWLDSVKAGEELSLRKVDAVINANGTAKLAIKKYIEEFGDPREEAVNA